ncbi:hypothetical protein AB0D56_31650, partial [Streptomyces sp. NPDC048209]
AGAFVWVWGRMDGRWGEPLAEGAVGDAMTEACECGEERRGGVRVGGGGGVVAEEAGDVHGCMPREDQLRG